MSNGRGQRKNTEISHRMWLDEGRFESETLQPSMQAWSDRKKVEESRRNEWKDLVAV